LLDEDFVPDFEGVGLVKTRKHEANARTSLISPTKQLLITILKRTVKTTKKEETGEQGVPYI